MNFMHGGDPASSNRASTRHTPADDADSLHDLLAEPLHFARLAEPRMERGCVVNGPNGIEYAPLSKARVIALVAAQIESASLDPQDGGQVESAPRRKLNNAEIVEIMTMLGCDENHSLALRALCWLRVLGKEGRSLDAIGAEFGVVRATVDAIYNGIKRRYEKRQIILTSRADKSPAAREACRQRRLGKRKPKREWTANNLWKHPMLIPTF